MRQHERNVMLVAMVFAGLFSSSLANGQQLWKYTDKDGKVTYSDKAPKPGEKAEAVTSDASTNVISAPRNTLNGVPQKLSDVKGRADAREKMRDQLRKEVDAAREQLAAAKKALEDGRDPTSAETQVVVGRNAKGVPTGSNSSIRKPEYYERVAKLEESVKKAEENVEKTEANMKKNAP